MDKRPVAERMAEAKADMVRARRRTPRVFFLSPDDYAEFIGLYGNTAEWAFVPFYQGGRPGSLRCPLFEGVAVRESRAQKPVSRLFCCVGTSKTVAAV